jgi:hypothetical protein
VEEILDGAATDLTAVQIDVPANNALIDPNASTAS